MPSFSALYVNILSLMRLEKRMLKTLGLSKDSTSKHNIRSNGEKIVSADSSKENHSYRDHTDAGEIVRKLSATNPIEHKNSVTKDNSNIVGNAFSFFNKNDKQELRYSNDDEEQRDRELYSLNNDDDDDDNENENDNDFTVQEFEDANSGNNETNNVTNNVEGNINANFEDSKGFSFIPNMFRNETGEPRMFRFRRKKKEKKRHSVPDIEEPEIITDVDKFAGIRAQNLIGLLTFATPSLSLIASCLLQDERGISRAPLLLTLLGFRLTDISPNPRSINRKFRIDLEYGVGPQRLKWAVERSAKDLLVLHSRFKLGNLAREVFGTNIEYPKFPITSFKNERRFRTNRVNLKPTMTLASSKHGPDMVQASRLSIGNNTGSDQHERRSILSLRNFVDSASISSSELEDNFETLKQLEKINEEYTKQVENYLNELIKTLALTPQSNRLFHFFEISPISSLLTYETGYKGKQGSVHIGGTAKSQGWRVGHFKANDLKGMIDRRLEKWLLIRHSYIMYVSDIISTLPLDVFLVDSKFNFTYKQVRLKESNKEDDESDEENDELAIEKKLKADTDHHESLSVFKHLKIVLQNSERKLTLLPKSEKEQKLWIQSLTEMKESTLWSKHNRFDSFAPVRYNCYARWFVDGRDYFWAISSAIEMAKDVIYIHDWWLSPEVYLRRPANGNQHWRLDRLLQRKARQGVKIFVILYRNVGTTVATDSLYTKHSLLALHEDNVHVIRSPNQLLQNTYFWAHHEKICVIDHSIAFLGGIDLCYGRYDSSDHALVDDSQINFLTFQDNQVPTEEELANFQIFPGKDYSNTRVRDFHDLNKPYETMYDRNVTPRMPMHDVHMLTSGQVARDVSRFFVQRWNYLLRQKRPSRFTPILTPPPDFSPEEEEVLKLGGSCEMQIVRSAGNWSLGLEQHEQSIQNAYLKLIETSEHFIYIENQFFITSCEIDGTEIKNRVGDALVDRIIRAHKEGTTWRAIIVIPIMPGFSAEIDEPEASAIRLIMKCQYMSISKGPTSIFAKLKRYGIEPADYITFFSLRKWGMIGPDRNLITEQVYVHAKIMVVDDRTAIIGSANINERSLLGSRDSEIASIIRDHETISTKMDGQDYVARKFAHSLRVRLMREHLGVAVDLLDLVERRFKRFENYAATSNGLKAVTNNFKSPQHQIMSAMVELASRDVLDCPDGTFRWKHFQTSINSSSKVDHTPLADIDELEASDNAPTPVSLPISFNNRTGSHEANKGIRDKKKHSYDARVQHSKSHQEDLLGVGMDKYKSKLAKRARLNSNWFLKNLAQQTMGHKAYFLPDIDPVLEFLELDDFAMTDEMDEESELIIYERNKERWLLLKKIAYLQRVYSRQLDAEEVENKKRVRAGLPISRPCNSNLKEERFGNVSLKNDPKVVSPVDLTNPEPIDISESSTNGFDKIEASDFSDNIPIVSLSDEGVKSLIESINPPHVENFKKFVDPYCFEDPIDGAFFEDLWFEHARRNTEIFRIVFHNQPDNEVETWGDYKKFTKFQKAFNLAQEEEARRRNERKLFGDNISSDSDNESIIGRGSKRQSVSVRHVDENVGLLGQANKTKEELTFSNKSDSNGTYNDGSIGKSTDRSTERSTKSNDDLHTNSKRNKKRVGGFATRQRVAAGQRIFDRLTSEKILNEVQGHLILHATDWLTRELEGDNWFYNTDRLPPIDIFD